MSYGSREAVEDAEEECREDLATLIANGAAALVAAGDMSREDAIEAVATYYRLDGEADADVTGTVEVENTFPFPSFKAPASQIAAIAAELTDKAQEAANSL